MLSSICWRVKSRTTVSRSLDVPEGNRRRADRLEEKSFGHQDLLHFYRVGVLAYNDRDDRPDTVFKVKAGIEKAATAYNRCCSRAGP